MDAYIREMHNANKRKAQALLPTPPPSSSPGPSTASSSKKRSLEEPDEPSTSQKRMRTRTQSVLDMDMQDYINGKSRNEAESSKSSQDGAVAPRGPQVKKSTLAYLPTKPKPRRTVTREFIKDTKTKEESKPQDPKTDDDPKGKKPQTRAPSPGELLLFSITE